MTTACPSPTEHCRFSWSKALANIFPITENDTPHFRIIPSLERWPILVRFADTLWGRGCILFAYIALFASCGGATASWEFFLLLGILALAPLSPGLKFFSGSMAFALFILPDLSFGQATNGQEIAYLGAAAHAIHERLSPHLYFYRAAILVGCVLFFALLDRIAIYRKASSPMPALFVVWAMLVFAALQLPNRELTGILACLFAAKVGLCLCWAGYLQLARRGGARPSHISAALFPLLGAAIPGPSIITNPASPELSPRAHQASSKDFGPAISRIKGLKLLLWTRLLLLVRSCTVYFFFGVTTVDFPAADRLASLHWPNYQYMGVASYAALPISPPQTWAVVFINLFVDFFLRFGLLYGATIAVVRLSGIYVPRFIVRPYLAKTFNEYYRRSLYFYSEAIVHFFFLPSWRRLYFFRAQKKLRLFLSLFLSLGVGGWLLHVSWAANYFLIYDWRTVVSYFLSWTPYYALISVASWWSAAGPDWRISWLPERASRALTIFAIFTVHALLLTLLPRNPEEGWDERLKLMATLFQRP